MPDRSSNPTDVNITYGYRIQAILNWAKQHKGSWNTVFPYLWSNIEELNKDSLLTETLRNISEDEDSSLFTNQELIVQILEEQPFDWHNQDRYLNLYEQTLEELLPYPTAGRLMKFLASIRIGVRQVFFESIRKRISDQELLLELQLLCVMRSKTLKETKELEIWVKQAESAIQAYSDKANAENWSRAVYQLPVLGLLLYKDKPRDFLQYCMDVSYAVQPIDRYAKLSRHLKLYYRNAVLKVCKNKSWYILAEFKKHNKGWAADFFEWSFQAPPMETYADQLAKWEQEQVKKQLTRYDSQATEEKLDSLIKKSKKNK